MSEQIWFMGQTVVCAKEYGGGLSCVYVRVCEQVYELIYSLNGLVWLRNSWTPVYETRRGTRCGISSGHEVECRWETWLREAFGKAVAMLVTAALRLTFFYLWCCCCLYVCTVNSTHTLTHSQAHKAPLFFRLVVSLWPESVNNRVYSNYCSM